MSNAIRCIDHRFAFKNYAIACIQPELSEIDNSAPKKAVRNSSSNMMIHIPFFSRHQYEPIAEWLRLVTNSTETRVRILHGAKPSARAAAILRGTELVSALTRVLFILLRSL